MFNIRALGRYLALVAAFALALASAGAAAAVDPTKPPATAQRTAAPGTAGAANWRVEAIRTLGKRRVAVVNGQTVAKGEWIGGGRVERIETNAVIVVRDGKRERLPLGAPLVKHWSKQD